MRAARAARACLTPTLRLPGDTGFDETFHEHASMSTLQ
jgi:hypothetical protein